MALPANDDDLETNYTEQDVIDVSLNNEVYVDQEGAEEYMIHQFKDFVGNRASCTPYWEGKSDLAPSSSIVKLQAYNYNTTTWDDIDTDNASDANTDFVLTNTIADLTDYLQGGVITCRVYQNAEVAVQETVYIGEEIVYIDTNIVYL